MIGERVTRKEDVRFLTGAGRYLADLRPAGLKHAAILRSPVAHARVNGIDTTAAKALPGVVAVFTAADLKEHSRPLSHRLAVPGIRPLEWYCLADEKVRYVGEPLAVVVAESRYVAEDALELIELDLDELDVVTDVRASLGDDGEESAPLLFEEWGDNVFYAGGFANGDFDAAVARADGVLRETIAHHRIVGLPLEGHGACGHFDRTRGELLLYSSNQQPHNLRTVVADVTALPLEKVRVIAPDMGGGFGNKQHFHREELLIAVVATLVPDPVTWSADRSESLTGSVQSRQQEHDVEVAYRSDGRVLGVRTHVIADLGSPTLYFSSIGPALITTSMLPGTYDIEAFEYRLTGVATNKPPMGAYRGFGQPQANFTIERVMDLVADATGVDPADVRRRNMVPDAPRPYFSATGNRYDTPSFHEQMEVLLDELDYPAVRRDQEEARREGRLVGVGLANLVECSTANLFGFCSQFGGYEMASVVVQPNGHVSINCGTKSQGQGHQTIYAQIAADVLTIPMSAIDVSDGDTALLPHGMGTWGSRSATAGGGVVLKGTRQIRDKMTAIAAHMLRVDGEEVELSEGTFSAGAGRVTFAEVAHAAYLQTFLLPPGMDPGLATIASLDPGLADPFPDATGRMNAGSTFSTAAAAAVVEIDAGTGQVVIRSFRIVHDCGTVINPLLLDGQIQGGFAQALGAVLLEEVVHDAQGQPLTSTLLDYLIPSFSDVPRVHTHHREHPSELLGGFRGAGEATTICGPSAIANAVHDALGPLGVRVLQTNLSSRSIREMIRSAGVKPDPFARALAS
ncbi:xanthine dehydrogenase family protein molybdopterin-binding subunit [Pseudonocardia asaccharolytica]|uniref:Aldehyde dehydrogenase n=1 Tax=Pseudonocardia asaccharolytica DSM 44247 = NBRC 16224 TaxID=1123024 RepID=A0A511CZF2_9PSEU|nr:xanthine dehydrogenase family protein molybdopterin-binding subunit [Pseudonocardia asaccharolytica]GEL17921.1 aldehyde dehydrogenase [Pseudonocardia asaccharolytica DSM 44247 = NBRC 16224]